jgi:hypothetical protein
MGRSPELLPPFSSPVPPTLALLGASKWLFIAVHQRVTVPELGLNATPVAPVIRLLLETARQHPLPPVSELAGWQPEGAGRLSF